MENRTPGTPGTHLMASSPTLSSSFYNVCEDILIFIVQFLDWKELHRLARVCTRFKTLVYTSNGLASSWDDGMHVFCSVYDSDWWMTQLFLCLLL